MIWASLSSLLGLFPARYNTGKVQTFCLPAKLLVSFFLFHCYVGQIIVSGFLHTVWSQILYHAACLIEK